MVIGVLEALGVGGTSSSQVRHLKLWARGVAGEGDNKPKPSILSEEGSVPSVFVGKAF